MYILFLGIVKVSRTLIKYWFSTNKNLPIHKEIIIKVYKRVHSMKLDWLKLINAESGCVRDNCLGYFR